MYPPAIYKDRTEAGKKLGQKLKQLDFENVVVLAIPSGGVPIGKEVAKILNSPLDIIVICKIQFPWTTEAGFGAAATNGIVYLNSLSERLPQKIVNIQTGKAQAKVKRRESKFLKERRRVKVKGKTVILVDDGLAAGSTMLVAVQSVKKKQPTRIIIAVPTASEGAVKVIKPYVNKLISLYIHPKDFPFAVASSYQRWHDLTDQEVKDYLKK